MTHKLLLVDFENVQPIDLARLDDGIEVIIFVGSGQKTIPIELVTAAQAMGERVKWQRVDGNGRNALDFHIACHLGRVLERSPQLDCIVLSKDKGFDPLLQHLKKLGLECRRCSSLIELDPKLADVDEVKYKRMVEILGKSEKNARPRKVKTLSQHISAMFQKNIEQREIDRIIQLLVEKQLITESNNTITYRF